MNEPCIKSAFPIDFGFVTVVIIMAVTKYTRINPLNLFNSKILNKKIYKIYFSIQIFAIFAL